MKTQPASRILDVPAAPRNTSFSQSLVAGEPTSTTDLVSASDNRLARRDALSFSITFAVIALLTGTMLLYKVAVTMSLLTSFFFYASLAGMVIFAVRAILLTRQMSVDTTEQF